MQSASALDWQKASYQNKRATSASVINAMSRQGTLPVGELTVLLNERFKMIGNTHKNAETYRHLNISDEAIALIGAQNW